jgi:hypothetical protein
MAIRKRRGCLLMELTTAGAQDFCLKGFGNVGSAACLVGV